MLKGKAGTVSESSLAGHCYESWAQWVSKQLDSKTRYERSTVVPYGSYVRNKRTQYGLLVIMILNFWRATSVQFVCCVVLYSSSK